MTGSIYINNFNSDPNHVTLSPSASPSELMSKSSTLGFAWQKTLDALGMQHGYNAEQDNLYHVSGSVQEAKANARKLESQIGVITSLAIKREQYGYLRIGDYHKRFMGRIATKYLPELPEDYEFKHLIGDITEPFADDTNNDGVKIYYDTTREELRDYVGKQLEAGRLLHQTPIEELIKIDPGSLAHLTGKEFELLVDFRRMMETNP